jgi:lantibiotic modifying enzyme
MSLDVLETALRIGARLGATAIWSGGACGWLGDVSTARSVVTQSLDSNLYGGQAGIVLFLAHLAAATADRRAIALAEGAVKLLERQCADPAVQSGASFYVGLSGQAFAVGEAALLMGSPRLSRLEEGLASEARTAWRCQVLEPELVAGEAGVLSFALHRFRKTGTDADLAWAHASAARIASAAEHDALGRASWPTARGERLAGMAHGASGVIAALARLEHVAPDEGRHRLIYAALEFERGLFDATMGNWLDMRGSGGELAKGRNMVAWCHGAPGVGAARLGPLFRHCPAGSLDAETALDTTERHLRRALDERTVADGLCHGAAGLADVLWTAAAGASGERAKGQSSAALDWAASVESRLRFGAPGDLDLRPLIEAPALFTGLAGIGYALLRLQGPARPPDILGLPH